MYFVVILLNHGDIGLQVGRNILYTPSSGLRFDAYPTIGASDWTISITKQLSCNLVCIFDDQYFRL